LIFEKTCKLEGPTPHSGGGGRERNIKMELRVPGERKGYLCVFMRKRGRATQQKGEAATAGGVTKIRR